MTPREANEILVGDLNLVIGDVEELLRATAGEAGEKAKEIRARLATALASARATRERLQDQSVQVVKLTDHAIREHPYESVGVAFGVGLLIGVLVGHR